MANVTTCAKFTHAPKGKELAAKNYFASKWVGSPSTFFYWFWLPTATFGHSVLCAAAATFFSFLSSFLCSARFNPLLHHLNLLMLDFYQNTAVYPAQVLMYLHTQQRCIACEGKKEAAVAEVLLQKCRQWRNSVIRSTAKKGNKRWKKLLFVLLEYYMLYVSKKAMDTFV